MRLPVAVRLRHPAGTILALVLMHLLALSALLAVAWPVEAMALAAVPILWSMATTWCRQTPAALTLKADGGLALHDAAGATRDVEVDPATTSWSLLVALHYRIGERRESLFLPRDALDRDDFRRLRVWLQWRARFSAG